MAATSQGRQLTEQQRVAQQQVRAQFLAQFIVAWALLDTARLDETGPGWVAAVTRLVREFRHESARVATEYFWRFAAAEAPESVARPRVPDLSAPVTSPRPAAPRTERPGRGRNASPRPGSQRRTARELERTVERAKVRFDIDPRAFDLGDSGRTRIDIATPKLDEARMDRAVRVSLTVTGPVGQKSKIGRGKSVKTARDESFVEASGAASRHVLTGGRQSLLTLVQDNMPDPRWIRVTDGDPCAFCAMLAGRGPVYLTKDSAGFSAHDHCACTAEPVYHATAPWPGRAQEFHTLWNEHIRNRYSGKEARREWQRLYRRLQQESRQIA